MRASTLKGLSTACLVAGNLSMAGSIALWAVGRMSRDPVKQNDGLFVGLWVPAFYILSDRFAVAALDHEARHGTVEGASHPRPEDTVQGRAGKGILPTSRDILADEKNLDEPQTRPSSHRRSSVNIGPL